MVVWVENRNEVGSTIRALQYPRPDTSKARCGSRKAKIDSRDDDDVCSHVSCMDLATMAVETGDSGQPELFEDTQKRLEVDS